jgi:hypothetical protein
MNALLSVLTVVLAQNPTMMVDVRGTTIEVRNLQSGTFTQYSVGAGGPLAYDPSRSRVIYVAQNGALKELRSLNLVTGASSFLSSTSSVLDLEVDPYTGFIYLIQTGAGVYRSTGGNLQLFQSDVGARSVEIDPFREAVWYTSSSGSTLRRRSPAGVTTTVLALGASDFITDFVVDEANSRIIWAQDGASGKLLRQAKLDGSGGVTIRVLSNTDPANMCASYSLSIDDAGTTLFAACGTTLEKLVLATNTNTEISRITGTATYTDVDAYHARPVLERPWAPMNPTEFMSTNFDYRSSGFVITAAEPTVLRSLGALVNGANRVRLWDNATGAELVSAVVSGPASGAPAWTYTSITPYELVPGKSYTLSVDGGPGKTMTFFPSEIPNYPIASGAIVFEDAVEVPYGAPNATTARPTQSFGGWMASGIPDVEILTP